MSRDIPAIPGISEQEYARRASPKIKEPIMAKKVLNVKIAESLILIGENQLTYGAHIQGIVGEGEKAITSILSTPKDDESAGETFNTYIFIDPVTKTIKELTANAWLDGSLKSINVDSYPESIRANIIKSLNTVKGIFKSAPQIPVTKETAEALMEDARIVALHKGLVDTYNVMIDEINKEKMAYSNVGIDDFIGRYSFRKHVMLLGPRGLGKTFTVSKYLNAHSIPTEFIAGSNGTESIDLLGYYVKAADGSLVWMDGPLTAAFRTAQTTKSAFFIDEILRIPARELNILIGALTPDATGHYQLRTNRIVGALDGLGKSEVLRVPTENLWAIATTNIGSDYDTEDMDLALSDRFRMYEMAHSIDAVRGIVESCNVSGKFSDKTINQLMNLYTAVEALVQAKELTNTINVRYLCELLDMCPTEKEMKSYLFDLTSNVCSRTTDGNINEVEEATFKDTIKRIMK